LVERGAVAPRCGNLKTRTDARGVTVTYQYDAGNRLTRIFYGDQTVTLTWNSCANGVGRLCSVADGSGTTSYTYDAQGRVLTKTQTIGSVVLRVGYGYTDGRLTRVTLPSGQVVSYGWSDGRLASVGVNGAAQLTGIAWQPFGPVAGWTWGNGQAMVRRFDAAGRLKSFSFGSNASGSPDTRGLAFDAAGRIVALVDGLDVSFDQYHGYDNLDRLTSSRLTSAALTTYGYTYDLAGNRVSRTLNGSSTTYGTATTSNRLMSLSGGQGAAYTYDAAGNVTGDGSRSFTYDNAGRRVRATFGSVTSTFAYNALGQRVMKSGPGGTTLYAYDEQGQLLGEYDGSGNPSQETVWLLDVPVLTLRGGAVFYVQADHLNTPRRISRPSDNKPVWLWESEPFGNGQPDQNPAGLGNFVYNLRMPGQVYDQETGQFYNYYCDYDPGTGRYGESDPIGLRGGVNTYAFVGNNPTKYSDPRGLDRWGGDGSGSGSWTPDGWVWVSPGVGAPPEPALSPVCLECLIPTARLVRVAYAVCKSEEPPPPPITPQRAAACSTAFLACLNNRSIPESLCFAAASTCTKTTAPMIFPGYGLVQ
jgi:RHS repeat-associated protein